MAIKLLSNAKKKKADEFYTQLSDIEFELKNYKLQFRDKIVFCNCDDPYESNFFKYFALNFNHLGLKKLIATSYVNSSVAETEIVLQKKPPYKIEINEVVDANGDGAVDLFDVEYLLKNNKNVMQRLQGDGDFRSPECVALLKESDIVVTNPPFSLFREFVSLLAEHNKDFVIMGNTNALTYKEVFKLFKENRIRTGYTNFNVGMFFFVPDSSENFHKVVDGKKMVRVSTSCWFTNLEVEKHNQELVLYKRYSPEEYPTYDNYDAIEVKTYTEIPEDYFGVMGVPVTFLDKYNPEQFEIIDINPHFFAVVEQGLPKPKQLSLQNVGKKDPYARILIRRRR
ncbi:MAG: adenine-specific methyltransferase EcoRI family protein [Clostridia bacterium]|nr:adenine-specific methyltransferase EcoRI family protein [Clostridia bacterium]